MNDLLQSKSLPQSQYIDLPFPDGGLAGRFDPARGILEVQRRGVKHYFDLTQLAQSIDKCKILCYYDEQVRNGRDSV